MRQLGIDGYYGRVRLEDGTTLKDRFFSLGLIGANITVPFKEDAFRAADIISSRDKTIGAINTLVLKDGKLYGYNTDIDGIISSVKIFGDIKNVLILGAGGTAKAAVSAFLELGCEIEILNRSAKRLEDFLAKDISCFTFENFIPKKYDLIFNTTSAGLSDESYPCEESILKKLLLHRPNVMDAIYGKETPFLKLAREMGCEYKDGEDMLLWQGAYAFCKFFDGKFLPQNIYPLLKNGLTL